MKASELIQELQKVIDKYGDHCIEIFDRKACKHLPPKVTYNNGFLQMFPGHFELSANEDEAFPYEHVNTIDRKIFKTISYVTKELDENKIESIIINDNYRLQPDGHFTQEGLNSTESSIKFIFKQNQ